MDLQTLVQIQYCYDGVLNVIPFGLLLYSHIPTALTAFCFGIVLVTKKRDAVSTSLFLVCVLFAIWCFLDLLTWFSFIGAKNTMFSWSLVDMTGLLFFFFSYRFLYSFTKEKPLPFWQTASGITLLLPTIISTLFGLNLTGFDANTCEATEQNIVTLYPYLVQVIFICACIWLGISSFRKKEGAKKIQSYLASMGVVIFLSFFFVATFIVKIILENTSFQNAYNFTIYGLFGMPVLLMFLGYLIVKYQTFNIKLIGAQAIVAVLVLFDASQAAFSSSRTELVVNLLTILLVILFGSFLIRSVKEEIKSRERNEKLAKELARTNTKLRELDRQKSEFVSIASHQLRSPLTAIRGYASMVLEGSYGKIPAKATEVLERIQDSSAFMALSIEDFLNVSRIEQGRMKYECALTDIEEMTKKIVEELRGAAIKKGLVLLFRSKCEHSAVANIDPGKMRQVIYNILDNALKYTPKGSVTVVITDTKNPGKITLSIEDTGIGMSEETREKLFDKFIRAKNASAVNVSGTGLGLFVAKELITQMSGLIEVTSPGEGKGSTFIIEIPQKS